MPAASAICCREVRRPDVAMTEFAVLRISVRRVASTYGGSLTAVSLVALVLFLPAGRLRLEFRPTASVLTIFNSSFASRRGRHKTASRSYRPPFELRG